VIGGRSGPDDFGNVDVYDPTERTWEDGPAIPARGTHGAAVHDGAIHVFGGESQARGTTLAAVLRLEDDEWRQVATLPVARGYARAVTVGDDVLVVGGTTEPGASHASPGSDRVDRFSSR
jgi:N-acetylneuraminic acid mutarotase